MKTLWQAVCMPWKAIRLAHGILEFVVLVSWGFVSSFFPVFMPTPKYVIHDGKKHEQQIHLQETRMLPYPKTSALLNMVRPGPWGRQEFVTAIMQMSTLTQDQSEEVVRNLLRANLLSLTDQQAITIGPMGNRYLNGELT